MHMSISLLNGLPDHLYGTLLIVPSDTLHDDLGAASGRIVTRIVSAHTVGHNEQIRKISDRLGGRKYIILINLSFHAYIRKRK